MVRMKRPRREAFAAIEQDLLTLMESMRELGLSTAVELLELALAEVRDRKNEKPQRR
jgi:hypothetical protein